MMVYQWKQGARIRADATEVGREIAELGPAVEAGAVVKRARDRKSAMHDSFEWDDSLAAEEYRLTQAREIMRALVVVIDKEDEPDGVTTIRAYEHVDLGEGSEPRRAYVPTARALKAPELRAQVIARLDADIREAEETAGKYEYLSAKLGEAKRRLAEARKALAV
jgi:hypothetical protein